jgi:Lon protease-like protein
VLSAPKLPVPVFPLPGTVLFPCTQLPLHVFELRYRTMVREALSGERLVALALLKPGWEVDYHGSPAFHDIGCLARFEEVEWLTNDCYDLKVEGVARVRFTHIVKEFPYRAARIEILPQHPYGEDDPLVEMDKSELVATFERLLVALGMPSPHARVDRTATYEALVNTMCAGTDLEPRERLELLALDSVLERGRRIREFTERRLRKGRVARGGGSAERAGDAARQQDEDGEQN